jgi:hypothetical protein
MPKADVTKSIHDVFVGQDTVSDDEIFEMGLQSSHLAFPRFPRVFLRVKRLRQQEPIA